jgi:hypothetical protein
VRAREGRKMGRSRVGDGGPYGGHAGDREERPNPAFTFDVGGGGRAQKGRKAERNSVRSLAARAQRWRSVVTQQWRCCRDCCCTAGETKARWERGREWSGVG